MKNRMVISLLLLLLVGMVQAQDDTTTTEFTSTIDYFFVACEDRAVLDFSGIAQAGVDVYYQIFMNAGGSGDALTELRRVPVGGDYSVSQSAPYTAGKTVGPGGYASAYVALARESDPARVLFEDYVDDIQDGCVDPSYPTVDSNTADSPSDGTFAPGELISSSGILTPGGGVLNPVYATANTTPNDAVVVIGARTQDKIIDAGRTANPGLIFAECDSNPLADPGVLYDTDTLQVFWSWYARTADQVRDHINNAKYSITLNGQPFPKVNVSPITQHGGNYWAFYTVELGDAWRPGQYGITYQLEWNQPISDGYDEFGPGTENPLLLGSCTFEIEANPYGIDVVHVNPSIPLKLP